MTADEQTKAKAVLDRFLADNPELEELSARLATFNIFRALKIEDAEIRHSNTLAWLLDPRGSHGLGDVVLRRVISSILLQSEGETPGLSAAQVELLDFSDIEIHREWHHFDLLVIDHANDLVVLIENKVRAGVSKKQLERYYGEAQKQFPEFRILPVLLTLEEQAEDGGELAPWVPYSYSQLLRVIERISGQRYRQLAEPVAIFLSHYQETLRRLTMQDKPITDLCRAIYRKHRDAINLIVNYGMTSQFEEGVARAMEQHAKDYELLSSWASWAWFIPRSWAEVVPENSEAGTWDHLPRRLSVACWFNRVSPHSTRIHLVFEVCRMTDPALRLSCVKALKDAGFKLYKQAFKEDARYSRFYRDAEKVEDYSDADSVREAVETLLARAQGKIDAAASVFAAVFEKARSPK